MAKLTRQTLLTFGINAGGADIGVFGSLASGSPTYSSVIATIQSLAAWGTGWAGATIATNRPALEDMNAFCYVTSYGLNYLYQMGIPEWDSGTTYYQYSICQYGGVIYQSLVDSNLNNIPTPGVYWAILNYVDLTSAQTILGLKTFGSFPLTPSGAPTTDYQVDNKKSRDDAIAAAIATKALGSWASKTDNTVYQADTDGFVLAYGVSTGTFTIGYSDSSNPPTTVRAKEYQASASGSGFIMLPVKKDDYWKVTGSSTLYWIPFGS